VKEDLFNKDYLLFPLNLPEHWSLLVNYGGEVIKIIVRLFKSQEMCLKPILMLIIINLSLCIWIRLA